MFGFSRKGQEKPVVEAKDVLKERHVLNILDGSGHTTITFDPTNKAEVEKTRKAFNEIMTAQKGLAYTVTDGEAEVVKNFDPEAKETVVTPQIQGG